MVEFAFFYLVMIGVTFALMLFHLYMTEGMSSWDWQNILIAFFFGMTWPVIWVVITAILLLWCTMFVFDLFEVQ